MSEERNTPAATQGMTGEEAAQAAKPEEAKLIVEPAEAMQAVPAGKMVLEKPAGKEGRLSRKSSLVTKSAVFIGTVLASWIAGLCTILIAYASDTNAYVLSEKDYLYTYGYSMEEEQKLVSWLYALRYPAIAALVITALAAVIGMIFLVVSAGNHRVKTDEGIREEVTPGWDAIVPFDLFTCIWVTAEVIVLTALSEAGFVVDLLLVMLIGSLLTVCEVLWLWWMMSLACRVKNHAPLSRLLAVRLCKLCIRFLRACGRVLKRVFAFLGKGMMKLPVFRRTVLVMAVVCLFEFVLILNNYDSAGILIWWLPEKIIVCMLLLWILWQMKELQKAGEVLAAGNTGYQIDTSNLRWEFRRHGENLNGLAGSMSRAVEEQLKSERMKTELITNVSHDIKTPLTSIINYSELILQEPTDNQKILEYAQVLDRQSKKLKRLIEDLVEASKASTGNLEVNMAPCEAGIFVDQAAGEYEDKLTAADLTLVCRTPDQPVWILADGRRMWRVFDNLMNNICKYSQPGTRVYLTLEVKDKNAVITFRNTSREQLDISPEELMERFVRGDRSRNTEGNGLGLSIARSMIQLQGGMLQISIDGDLFKAILTFPVAS